MSVSSEMEDLQRVLDEVYVLTDLTRTTFGKVDWAVSDSANVDIVTTLIRLIDKSSFSALQVFHRLKRTIDAANERRVREGKGAAPQPAPSGQAPPSGQPSTMSAEDAAIVRRIRARCPDGRYDGGSDAELLQLFKHNRRVLHRSDDDVIAAMTARASGYALPSGE